MNDIERDLKKTKYDSTIDRLKADYSTMSTSSLAKSKDEAEEILKAAIDDYVGAISMTNPATEELAKLREAVEGTSEWL